MMGSCDTGIVTWYSLGASGYGAMVMVELIKVHQSCFPAPLGDTVSLDVVSSMLLTLDILQHFCGVQHAGLLLYRL